jgi:hypothetical protein
MLLFPTDCRHISLLFNDVPQDHGRYTVPLMAWITALYPVGRACEEADSALSGGAPGKYCRLGLVSRQKYTTEQTLRYRFCSWPIRNNKLRG